MMEKRKKLQSTRDGSLSFDRESGRGLVSAATRAHEQAEGSLGRYTDQSPMEERMTKADWNPNQPGWAKKVPHGYGR